MFCLYIMSARRAFVRSLQVVFETFLHERRDMVDAFFEKNLFRLEGRVIRHG